MATADPGAICTKGAERSYPASMERLGAKWSRSNLRRGEVKEWGYKES